MLLLVVIALCIAASPVIFHRFNDYSTTTSIAEPLFNLGMSIMISGIALILLVIPLTLISGVTMGSWEDETINVTDTVSIEYTSKNSIEVRYGDDVMSVNKKDIQIATGSDDSEIKQALEQGRNVAVVQTAYSDLTCFEKKHIVIYVSGDADKYMSVLING